MSDSPFDRILTSTPINGTAARVVSQSRATDEGPLTRDELIEILKRLERKHRLLKLALGIRNASQQRNAGSDPPGRLREAHGRACGARSAGSAHGG